jgi:hypothetical protein
MLHLRPFSLIMVSNISLEVVTVSNLISTLRTSLFMSLFYNCTQRLKNCDILERGQYLETEIEFVGP